MGGMSRVSRRIGVAALLAGTLFAWATWGAEKRASESAIVATVGPSKIKRADFDRQRALARQEFQRRRGGSIPEEVLPILDRQILERLIRSELMTLEAERRGIDASDAEAEAQLRLDPFFQTNGAFDAAKLSK